MFDRTVSTVANIDPELWAAIQAENRRQEEHIELIASENYTSPAVMPSRICRTAASITILIIRLMQLVPLR